MKALIIDTETTGTIDDPICYDIGFAVIDENGTTYEKVHSLQLMFFLMMNLCQTHTSKKKFHSIGKI